MHTHVHPQLFSPELRQQVNDKGGSSLGHNSPYEIQLSPKVAFAESEVRVSMRVTIFWKFLAE